MKAFKKILMFSLILLASFSAQAQKKRSKKDKTATTAVKPKKKSEIKPYKEVITAKAKSDDGIFMVHQVEELYYF